MRREEVGMDVFLTKPVDLDRLISALAVCKGSRVSETPVSTRERFAIKT